MFRRIAFTMCCALYLVLSTGCSGSSTASDATGSADAVGVLDVGDDATLDVANGVGRDVTSDLGQSTACGGAVCDPTTQICVEGNFGGPTSIGCRPVPSGCVGDRSCACVKATYCNTGLALCQDVAPNHIFCETGRD